MMPLLRAVFAAGLVFLGAVAIFMGCVLSMAFLKSGAISLSWGDRADQSRDVLLSTHPHDFWLYFVLIGLLPIGAGFAAIIVGRRISRRT
jgi:hypothetical protein